MLLDQLKSAMRGRGKKLRPALSGPLEISGSIAVTRDATIDAVIHGPVQASHNLQLGNQARIEGPLECVGRLTVDEGAVLNGSCRAGALILEKGARFNGPLKIVPESKPDPRKKT
jgi:cytoskeletal protein CcmA (bactofilin family)